MSVDRKVEQIFSSGNETEQTNKLTALVDEVLSSGSSAPITALFNRLLGVDIPQQLSKTVLVYLATNLRSSDSSSSPTSALNAVCLDCISTLKSKANATLFDEVDAILRNICFDYYLSIDEHHEAAAILAGLNLESTSKPYTGNQKADTLIKVAECYLMTKDSIEAEIFTGKAAVYMNDIDRQLSNSNASNSSSFSSSSTGGSSGSAAASGSDSNSTANAPTAVSEALSLQLRYRAAVAQIMDGNRKFVEAAFRYYELSRLQSSIVVAEDLLQLLGKAVTCAILGKTGPQRTRVLGLLQKDDRLEQLDTLPQYAGHSSLLRKVHQEQILKAADVAAFEASVEPHHRAMSADAGLTIVEKAVMEHNLTATARVYVNLHMTQLASILRLTSATHAEQVAARLISEGRLRASIDQTAGVLYFLDEAVDTPAAQRMEHITSLCNEVSSCAYLAKEIVTY